jgi:hypothetical protein
LTNQTIKTKDDPTSESSRVIKYYLWTEFLDLKKLTTT